MTQCDEFGTVYDHLDPKGYHYSVPSPPLAQLVCVLLFTAALLTVAVSDPATVWAVSLSVGSLLHRQLQQLTCLSSLAP